MSRLVISDLHLSAKPREDYRHQFLAKLPTAARIADCTGTIILGDLTEEKDEHGDWLTNQVVDMVERFARLGPVDILQGNHDSLSDPNCPFFGFLRHLDNVRWIGCPDVFQYKDLGRCFFLPHTRDYVRDWNGLDFKGFDWIFAHNTFQGADVGFGMRLDGIPLDIFPKDARIVSGDVHVPQTLGRLTYVGAPYTIDFGDDYKPRCLIIDRKSFTSIPAAKTDPQKRLFDVAGAEGLQHIDPPNEGDIVKMRVHLRRKDAADWPSIREKARAWAQKHGALVHSIVPELTEREGLSVEFKHADPKSDQDLLRDFGKHRGIDEKTLKVGMRLL